MSKVSNCAQSSAKFTSGSMRIQSASPFGPAIKPSRLIATIYRIFFITLGCLGAQVTWRDGIGLKRYKDEGDLHFVTFSCFRRPGYLRTPAARDLFEDGLDRVRRRYEFEVVGYVVMPEHVHLLVSEPCVASLDVGLQALKLSVARRSERGQFWQGSILRL